MYSIDDGQLLIRYGPRSTFKNLLLELKRISTDEGSGYSLQPDHALLRDGLLVSLRKEPAGRKQQRIYFRGRGDWKLVSGQRDTSEAYVTALIDRTPGDIAILTDTDPPFVTDVRLPPGSRRKPVISFRFGDDLAGVDYESLKTYIDEVFVVPEIDGENHRAVCRFPDPLLRGSHLLRIRISDVLGNSATVERRFEVR